MTRQILLITWLVNSLRFGDCSSPDKGVIKRNSGSIRKQQVRAEIFTGGSVEKVTRIWSDILGFGRMAGKLLNPDKGNWDLADSAVEPLNFEP